MSADGPWAPPAVPPRTPEQSDPLDLFSYPPVGTTSPGVTRIVPSSTSRSRRPNWWLGFALVMVLALLVGGGVIVLQSMRDNGQRSASPAASPKQQPHRATKHHSATTHGHAGGPVITSAGASRVLAAYWPTHESALVAGDLPTLANMSTGPAKAWEQAAVACHCVVVSSPRPLLDASYFVPRQTTYPASFITEAQTQYSGIYWAEVLVFTKARAGAAWLVEEDSGFGPPPGMSPRLGAPTIGANGFDQPVPARLHRRALHAAADLAGLWQQAKNTGAVPASNEFQLTGQTGTRAADLAAYPQDHLQRNGLLGHFTFYTSKTDHLVVMMSSNGYALACQPVRETVDYTPMAGDQVYQDAAQRNWGTHLAPGFYREVVSRDVWQTCFLIPPRASEPIGVLNHDVGGASVTGIR